MLEQFFFVFRSGENPKNSTGMQTSTHVRDTDACILWQQRPKLAEMLNEMVVCDNVRNRATFANEVFCFTTSFMTLESFSLLCAPSVVHPSVRTPRSPLQHHLHLLFPLVPFFLSVCLRPFSWLF